MKLEFPKLFVFIVFILLSSNGVTHKVISIQSFCLDIFNWKLRQRRFKLRNHNTTAN